MHDLTVSFFNRVRLFGVIVLLITEVDFRINFIWPISLKMIQLTIQHYMLIEYLLFLNTSTAVVLECELLLNMPRAKSCLLNVNLQRCEALPHYIGPFAKYASCRVVVYMWDGFPPSSSRVWH